MAKKYEIGPDGKTQLYSGGGTATSGSGAPASTPLALGLIYIDTAASPPDVYISTGTSSSADWSLQGANSEALNSFLLMGA